MKNLYTPNQTGIAQIAQQERKHELETEAYLAEQERLENEYWIELNNLLLSVQRGETNLTISVSNRLRTLLALAWPYKKEHNSYDIMMIDNIRKDWETSFQELGGWNNV